MASLEEEIRKLHLAQLQEAKKDSKESDDDSDDDDEDKEDADDSDNDDSDDDEKSEKSDKKEDKKKPPFMKKEVKEESEQLDEISKKTLNSYLTKSDKDRTKLYDKYKSVPGGDKDASRKLNNRQKGEERAVDRLSKIPHPRGIMAEESEHLAEISIEKMKAYTKASKADAANKEQELKTKFTRATAKKYLQRKTGQETAIRLAGKKVLNSEELESMDNNLEETAAADSLHPAARSISDDKALNASKVGMMKSVMHMMNGMSKEDMTHWFDQTMAQFGPGKTYGVGDNSGKNTSSIDAKPSAAAATTGPKTKDGMPKLNVKEDIDAMFEGQDLSEDFKETASTLFEAALNARMEVEVAALEEAYVETLEEEITAIAEELTNKLDSYLDYVAEEWMEENRVAIESTLRNELAEDFINGLRDLFAEHYISVPEEKVEVVEALAEKVTELEEAVDTLISENSELKQNLIENVMADIIEEVSADLALTQQEKFQSLAEGIEFDGDLEKFEKKLKIIKEQYFRKEKTVPSSNIVEETFEGEELNESVRHLDPSIKAFVDSISRTVKK